MIKAHVLAISIYIYPSIHLRWARVRLGGFNCGDRMACTANSTTFKFGARELLRPSERDRPTRPLSCSALLERICTPHAGTGRPTGARWPYQRKTELIVLGPLVGFGLYLSRISSFSVSKGVHILVRFVTDFVRSFYLSLHLFIYHIGHYFLVFHPCFLLRSHS